MASRVFNRWSYSQLVLARLDRLLTKRTGQELNMLCLVLGDLHEAAVHPTGKTIILKVLLTELRESARVERVLEMLKGERKVENLGVCEE